MYTAVYEPLYIAATVCWRMTQFVHAAPAATTSYVRVHCSLKKRTQSYLTNEKKIIPRDNNVNWSHK